MLQDSNVPPQTSTRGVSASLAALTEDDHLQLDSQLRHTDGQQPYVVSDLRLNVTDLFRRRELLHVRWQAKNYGVYAEYYFECWVTDSESGSQIKVPELVLRWRHGQTKGQEFVNDGALVAKGDRTYNLGADGKVGATAVATLADGSTIVASAPDDFVWGAA